MKASDFKKIINEIPDNAQIYFCLQGSPELEIGMTECWDGDFEYFNEHEIDTHSFSDKLKLSKYIHIKGV